MTKLMFIKFILFLILFIACGLCVEEVISRELKKKCFTKKESTKNRIVQGNKNGFKRKEREVALGGGSYGDGIRISEELESEEGDANFLLGRRKSYGRKSSCGIPFSSSSWTRSSTFFNGRNKGVNKQRKGASSPPQSTSTGLQYPPAKGNTSLNSQGESSGKETADRTKLESVGGENNGIRRPLSASMGSSKTGNGNGADSLFPPVDQETEPPEFSPDTIENEEEENTSKKSIEERNRKEDDTIISGIETGQGNSSTGDFYLSNPLHDKGSPLQERQDASWLKKQKWPSGATGRDFDTLLEVTRRPTPKKVPVNVNERKIEGGMEQIETKQESKDQMTPYNELIKSNDQFRSESDRGERKSLTSADFGGCYSKSSSPTKEIQGIDGESRKGTTPVMKVRSFFRKNKCFDSYRPEGERGKSLSIKNREKRKTNRFSNKKNVKKRKKCRKRREGWKKFV